MVQVTVYQLRIVPAEPDPSVLPRADVYARCTRAGCTAEYLMEPPNMRLAEFPPEWLDPHRPRFDDINLHAARKGWTYTDEHGPRCPEHRYGKPVAEIESHEAAQVTTNTERLPVEEIKAALEDEGEGNE